MFAVNPWTPLKPVIGCSIILTLSILPTLMCASWRTPNNSKPTILQGKADNSKVA